MKRFILRHMSTLLFLIIYLLLVGSLIGLESFVLETQIGLFQLMILFILGGAALDYALSKNPLVPLGYKIFAQILPLCVFVLIGISYLLPLIGSTPSELFNYLIYPILSLPFLIAGFEKSSHKSKMISSLIGTGLMFFIYLYLTKMTDQLNEGTGLTIYIISVFVILYASSSIPKLPILGAILGLLGGCTLFWLYRSPVTAEGKLYGWDYDIAIQFEQILLILICLSILLTFLGAFLRGIRAHS